ncbi:MAG: hypothetical protein JJU33_04370 [Phycisphaerales bacterium]|nr:hypothetical protein [Phycisphaerales bacterium]
MRASSIVLPLAVMGAAGSVSAAPVMGLNGTVGFQIVGSSSGGAESIADSSLAFTDGVGLANFSSLGTGLSGGTVALSITQLNATTRRLSVTMTSDDSVNGFYTPGTNILGSPLTSMGFSLGMEALGAFPGPPNIPINDPEFAGILGDAGTSFRADNSVFFSGNFFAADYPDGSFGARVFYLVTSGGQTVAGGLDDERISRFEGFIDYQIQSVVIPLPTGAGLASLGLGLVALRRRR